MYPGQHKLISLQTFLKNAMKQVKRVARSVQLSLTGNVRMGWQSSRYSSLALSRRCKSGHRRSLYQRPQPRLAFWAEVGTAVPHNDPLDGAAANGAGLASLMSNLEIEMGCAQLAIGTDAGIHAGASEGGRELSRIPQMRHRSF